MLAGILEEHHGVSWYPRDHFEVELFYVLLVGLNLLQCEEKEQVTRPGLFVVSVGLEDIDVPETVAKGKHALLCLFWCRKFPRSR